MTTILGASALAASSLLGPQVASADSRRTHAVPHMTAWVSNRAVHLSNGGHLRAGRVVITVRTHKGDHTLQLARLRHGYTLAQAQQDLPKALNGDVAAVRRVDHNISWRGGSDARPGKPGKFAVTLGAGKYVAIDQDSNSFTWLKVHGTRVHRSTVRHTGTLTAFTYGFGNSPARLPAHGWINFRNQSDQPHFAVIQRVKPGTTSKMVRRYLASGSSDDPPWLMHAMTDSGVISPKTSQLLRLDLPAGRYVVICWWPDDETGMPHAFMGMWKLINLR